MGNFDALSSTKQRLDEERRHLEEMKRISAEAEAAAAALEAANLDTAQKQADGTPFRLKSRIGSVQLKWKGPPSGGGGEGGTGADAEAPETIEADMETVEVTVGGTGRGRADAARLVPSSPGAAERGSGVEDALHGPGQSNTAKRDARVHLGMVAAGYLEKLARELLKSDAPLLLKEIREAAHSSPSPRSPDEEEARLTDLWVNTLMTLATRCCATVEPDVRSGDLLDIRPYCKIKVIPGGTVGDSAYLSGVVFHRNVAHKRMARSVSDARIMILNGGIEYTRTENRIASLDTLLEQEERYMEILVTKIFKLRPDVLIVSRSVCRKAQELLLRANIVLIQFVKLELMARIARQTGATVLTSIDHVMNSTILGKGFCRAIIDDSEAVVSFLILDQQSAGHCRRFRLVSFRDNDVWSDSETVGARLGGGAERKSVPALLSRDLPNHERQAALAARRLGEEVLDGTDAVQMGLAKRGVVRTYVMIEGCPKELGCTVVLRGASRPALKMVKRVLRFLINCSYNMKLETSYVLERCCRLPPSYEIPKAPCCSSSLCVDFGQPPNNRKSRPWNGSKSDPSHRSLSGKITPMDHQVGNCFVCSVGLPVLFVYIY